MHNGPQVHIRPARESDTKSACDAVNAVAAEKWYLATVDGFSLEQTRAFLKRVMDGSLPQVLAVAADEVVGFCDILPNTAKGFTHGIQVLRRWSWKCFPTMSRPCDFTILSALARKV